MPEVVTVSAYLAGWAADTAKPSSAMPAATAERMNRKEAVRRQRPDNDDGDAESVSTIIQATTVALDLMEEGNRQPRSTLRHALESYADND